MNPIGEHDYIEAAWGECADGPGWANSFIKVLVFNQMAGKYRIEWIQRAVFDVGLSYLFPYSRLATWNLTAYVRNQYRWPDEEEE